MTVTVYAVGGGQMAEAILRAALKKEVIDPSSTTVTDIAEQRVEYLREKYGFDTQAELDKKKLTTADIILLGIRPQDNWKETIAQIGATQTKAQVISIIAGVTLAQLQKASESKLALTRIIPNTLTDTGYGYSGAALGGKLTES